MTANMYMMRYYINLQTLGLVCTHFHKLFRIFKSMWKVDNKSRVKSLHIVDLGKWELEKQNSLQD